MNSYPATASALPNDQSADHFLAATASEPVYTIGKVARRFGLTLRTLRFYESRGLIKPVRRGNARLYRPQDVERLAVIIKAKKLGLTLTAIGQLIAGEGSEQTLRLSREACEAQIAVLERRLTETQEALAELRTICGPSDARRTDRQ